MDQRSALTLKSNLKLAQVLLHVESVLHYIVQREAISPEDFETISGIPEQKNKVNELIKTLTNKGGQAYNAILFALNNTSDELPHQRLHRYLTLTHAALGQANAHIALSKEDVQVHLSLMVRGQQQRTGGQDGYQQLSALIQAELERLHPGCIKQMLVMQYGLLVKRLELSQLILVCQIQPETNYNKIRTDIRNNTFGSKIWDILIQNQPFEQYKRNWTLGSRLQSSEDERLQAFEASARDADDTSDDDDAYEEAPMAMGNSLHTSMPPSVRAPVLQPIPLDMMEQAQKVVWNLLLSYITGGSAYHFRHFYHATKKCIPKTDITLLCSNEGFTLFHEVIRNKRADFMKVFQFFGLLEQMYSMPVTEAGGEYANCMPTELAARLNALKERNEMEKLVRVEKSLERDQMKNACRHGDLQTFKRRLEVDYKRVGVVAEGKTCLDWAITSGSADMVKVVIKAEKRINHRREDGGDQIALAVLLGYQPIIQVILEYIPYEMDAIQVDGKPIMEKVAEFGDIETFNVLFSRNATIPETTLAVASANGRTEFIRECLRLYGDQCNVNARDRRRKTPLHFATERGHPSTIELLFQHGADLMARDKRHRCVLHSAAENGKPEVLAKIVERARSENKLHTLVDTPDRYLGSELCFLVRGRDQEMSAWHYVQVDRGVLEIFRIKTRGGAVDVAQYGRVIRSGWGTNPSEEIIQEVESQFDMANIQENSALDMLPLHVAILKNNPEVAIELIGLTRDINKTDCFGMTPLHYACMRGEVKVVAALDERGANRNLRDNKSRTPVMLADLNNHASVIEYMRSGTLLQATQTFLETNVAPVLERLSNEELQRRSQEGENMKQYIKNILRDLVGDVNLFLYDELQTGPVTEESQPSSF